MLQDYGALVGLHRPSASDARTASLTHPAAVCVALLAGRERSHRAGVPAGSRALILGQEVPSSKVAWCRHETTDMERARVAPIAQRSPH